MKKKLIALIALCLCAGMLLSGCAEEPVTVRFGDAGWDSIRFHNAVAMLIGETAYNIVGEEVSGTTAITYSGLLSGDIQVYMEIWTDNLQTYPGDLESGAIKELSVNFDDNMQGLYVPRYVIEGDPERGIAPMAPDLKTVQDLAGYSDLFVDPDAPSKGRIYGAISGWQVDEIMRLKVAHYGLDQFYNYMDPGSDAALAAAITAAYEKGEPIVSYYWEPTWVTGKYDLVVLEDAPYEQEAYLEGKTACPSTRVTICVSADFYNSNKDYCDFLSKYQTSSALTAQALAYMQDTGADYEQTAKWFLTQNDALLSQWLPADKAKLVREKLAQ